MAPYGDRDRSDMMVYEDGVFYRIQIKTCQKSDGVAEAWLSSMDRLENGKYRRHHYKRRMPDGSIECDVEFIGIYVVDTGLFVASLLDPNVNAHFKLQFDDAKRARCGGKAPDLYSYPANDGNPSRDLLAHRYVAMSDPVAAEAVERSYRLNAKRPDDGAAAPRSLCFNEVMAQMLGRGNGVFETLSRRKSPRFDMVLDVSGQFVRVKTLDASIENGRLRVDLGSHVPQSHAERPLKWPAGEVDMLVAWVDDGTVLGRMFAINPAALGRNPINLSLKDPALFELVPWTSALPDWTQGRLPGSNKPCKAAPMIAPVPEFVVAGEGEPAPLSQNS